jgi:probable rRNA maturation factor
MIFIDVETKSKRWEEVENSAKIVKNICKKLIPLTDLEKILTKNFRLEISVSLVSDAQIKKINHQFRRKNKATDVLSFPTIDENLVRKIGLKKLLKDQKYLFLGDIVVAYETVKKESLAQNKIFKNHLTHLLLHSILHLIGFDHESDEMAKEMENLEIKILEKLRIKNPYQLIK